MSAADYRHLLAAVDFEPVSASVLERSCRLRDLFGARLTLLHVVEQIAPPLDYSPVGLGLDPGLPVGDPLERELLELARAQMDELGAQLGVPPADRLVRTGAAGPTLDAVAAELEADLVVVGSHGRHGLLGLFGATARTVLRSSRRDVLCVAL